MKINQFYQLIDAVKKAHVSKNVEITHISTEADGIFTIESDSPSGCVTIKSFATSKQKKPTPAATDVSK